MQTIIVNKQVDKEEEAKKVQAVDSSSKVLEAELVDENGNKKQSLLEQIKERFKLK